MNLNVGCRNDIKPGCLNVDIKKYSPDIDLICDAHKLPFRDKSFKNIFLFHVLEHLINPYEALKDMKRVAYRVIIKIPNGKYNPIANDTFKVHFFSWIPSTLENFLKQIFPNVKIFASWNFRTFQKKSRLGQFIRVQRLRLFSFFITNEVTAICS